LVFCLVACMSVTCSHAAAATSQQDIDTSRFSTERKLAPDEDEDDDFTSALFESDEEEQEQHDDSSANALGDASVQDNFNFFTDEPESEGSSSSRTPQNEPAAPEAQNNKQEAAVLADDAQEYKFTDSKNEASVLTATQDNQELKFTDNEEESFVLEDFGDDVVQYESSKDSASQPLSAEDASTVLEYIDAEQSDIEYEKQHPNDAFNTPISAHPFFASPAAKTATWVTIAIMTTLWLMCSMVIVVVMCCCCMRTMTKKSDSLGKDEAHYEKMTDNA